MIYHRGGIGAELNIFAPCKLAKTSLQAEYFQTKQNYILIDVLEEMDCEDIQESLILKDIIQLLVDKERYVVA